jgi:hypothetical protein
MNGRDMPRKMHGLIQFAKFLYFLLRHLTHRPEDQSFEEFVQIKEDKGVCAVVPETIVLPVASAGSTLYATRFSGKLKGVMIPITSGGSRIV